MANVVIDASSPVGALRRHSRSEAEIRGVFARPKVRKHLRGKRGDRILELISTAAVWFSPTETVTECRDPKDNKYLELALAAAAATIVRATKIFLY